MVKRGIFCFIQTGGNFRRMINHCLPYNIPPVVFLIIHCVGFPVHQHLQNVNSEKRYLKIKRNTMLFQPDHTRSRLTKSSEPILPKDLHMRICSMIDQIYSSITDFDVSEILQSQFPFCEWIMKSNSSLSLGASGVMFSD